MTNSNLYNLINKYIANIKMTVDTEELKKANIKKKFLNDLVQYICIQWVYGKLAEYATMQKLVKDAVARYERHYNQQLEIDTPQDALSLEYTDGTISYDDALVILDNIISVFNANLEEIADNIQEELHDKGHEIDKDDAKKVAYAANALDIARCLCAVKRDDVKEHKDDLLNNVQEKAHPEVFSYLAQHIFDNLWDSEFNVIFNEENAATRMYKHINTNAPLNALLPIFKIRSSLQPNADVSASPILTDMPSPSENIGRSVGARYESIAVKA